MASSKFLGLGGRSAEAGDLRNAGSFCCNPLSRHPSGCLTSDLEGAMRQTGGKQT